MPSHPKNRADAPTRDDLAERDSATVEIVRRPRGLPRKTAGLALAALLVAGALALWVAAGDRPGADPPAIEEARRLYDGLRPGMSREQVERALGGPGEEISWRRLHGTVIETYAWNPTAGSTILVTFQNGEVVRASELGLR